MKTEYTIYFQPEKLLFKFLVNRGEEVKADLDINFEAIERLHSITGQVVDYYKQFLVDESDARPN